ncbi:hypothetical protein HYH03_014688 [Edaphochlamys debaryana]|uniref:Uncharacterized protein n=1 Tax=Edaphochlamys debaryana TaxID=47281 RepID=A0A835XKT9_9CHLO|nr:hypothetical protein HYH03_014688 [Edaphochlamys debaryana]|eukprot:KAG2486632.1 hypothetical protein HYH03_014688 [Edaphochlamys debaryana]
MQRQAGLGIVLTDRDLLPLIVAHLNVGDRCTLRALNRDRLGLQLLDVFVDASRLSPLRTTTLRADAVVALCADRGPQLLAQAFPHVQHLLLRQCDEVDADALAAALQALLGSGGSWDPPLLPCLEELELLTQDEPCLPPALGAALRGATQLRALRLGYDLQEASDAEPLAGLVGLRSLVTGQAYNEHVLRAFIPALTGLTTLSFSLNDGLDGDIFAGLPNLVDLTARHAGISVADLVHLRGLTSLSCSGLSDYDWAANAEALGVIPGYDLPPGLRTCTFDFQYPECLPPLRGATPGQVEWDLTFPLQRGQHYCEEDGSLLPATEAALCRCLSALAGHTAPDSQITLEVDGDLLKPVGGDEGVGPGRRNHVPWLQALGRSGVTHASLKGVALSHQDLDALASCSSLESLTFTSPTTYPASALPRLSRLPSLASLHLDCSGWVGGLHPGVPINPPPTFAGALLALCDVGRWGGRDRGLDVILYYREELGEGVAAQMQELVEGLQEDLRGLGVDPTRLQLEAYGAD